MFINEAELKINFEVTVQIISINPSFERPDARLLYEFSFGYYNDDEILTKVLELVLPLSSNVRYGIGSKWRFFVYNDGNISLKAIN